MMQDMMKQCCDARGKPDFEHKMMKAFCTQGGQPDLEQMKQVVEKCGCHIA